MYFSFSMSRFETLFPRGEGRCSKKKKIANKVDRNLAITYLSPEVKTPTSKKHVNNRVHISNLTLTEVHSDDVYFYNTENREKRSIKIQFYRVRIGTLHLLSFCHSWFLIGEHTQIDIHLSYKVYLQPFDK